MICPTCNGKGWRLRIPPLRPGTVIHENDYPLDQKIAPCPECGGSGIVSCCDAAGSCQPEMLRPEIVDG
jgi:RecJ-like exonuclease